MGHTIRNNPERDAKEQAVIDDRKDRKFRSKKHRRARRKQKRER